MKCADIWRTNKKVDISELSKNAYIIILSCDRTNGLDYWKVADFWYQNNKAMWGGSRLKDLTEEEILRNSKYVGNLKEILGGE